MLNKTDVVERVKLDPWLYAATTFAREGTRSGYQCCAVKSQHRVNPNLDGSELHSLELPCYESIGIFSIN